MNSSKPSILFWCFLLLLVNQFSCKPEEEKKVDPQKHYYYLSAAQLAKTPYFTNPKFDTITYVNTQGDTFVFVKNKVDTGYVITSDETQGSQAKNLYYYQYLRNNYHSLKGNGKFGVTHYKGLSAFYGGAKDYLQIYLNAYDLWYPDRYFGLSNNDLMVYNTTFKNVTKAFGPQEGFHVFLNTSKGIILLVDSVKLDSLFILSK